MELLVGVALDILFGQLTLNTMAIVYCMYIYNIYAVLSIVIQELNLLTEAYFTCALYILDSTLFQIWHLSQASLIGKNH